MQDSAAYKWGKAPSGDDVAAPMDPQERRMVPNGDYCKELSNFNNETTYHGASRGSVVSGLAVQATHFFTTMLLPPIVVSSQGAPQQEQCPMKSNASKIATLGTLLQSCQIVQLPQRPLGHH
jgi:hypothetical protein